MANVDYKSQIDYVANANLILVAVILCGCAQKDWPLDSDGYNQIKAMSGCKTVTDLSGDKAGTEISMDNVDYRVLVYNPVDPSDFVQRSVGIGDRLCKKGGSDTLIFRASEGKEVRYVIRRFPPRPRRQD